MQHFAPASVYVNEIEFYNQEAKRVTVEEDGQELEVTGGRIMSQGRVCLMCKYPGVVDPDPVVVPSNRMVRVEWKED